MKNNDSGNYRGSNLRSALTVERITESKTREEKLLETIVASAGGVRLQVFILEAAKLDALALCHALESKLHSPTWQVSSLIFHFASCYNNHYPSIKSTRKAISVLEALLRYQVLSLLGGNEASRGPSNSSKSTNAETVPVQVPDLIDTGDETSENLTAQGTLSIDDHGHGKESVDDLFSGTIVDDDSKEKNKWQQIKMGKTCLIFSDHIQDLYRIMAVIKMKSGNFPRVFSRIQIIIPAKCLGGMPYNLPPVSNNHTVSNNHGAAARDSKRMQLKILRYVIAICNDVS
ncbi:hypothetical protein ACFE04_008579 [Oxalis oulophora]